MKRFAIFCRSSRFHLICMVVWALMFIPTVLIWSQSILWLGFMSIYAIVVGHAGAYQAARSEEAQTGGGE